MNLRDILTHEEDVRLSCGRKWMVAAGGNYEVLIQEYGKKTRLLYSGTNELRSVEEEALKMLFREEE